MSSISNDGINRVSDKPIGDQTKNIYCRIIDEKNDEDIGFGAMSPQTHETMVRQMSKYSGLSLSTLQRWVNCHMSKFGLKATTRVNLIPLRNDEVSEYLKGVNRKQKGL